MMYSRCNGRRAVFTAWLLAISMTVAMVSSCHHPTGSVNGPDNPVHPDQGTIRLVLPPIGDGLVTPETISTGIAQAEANSIEILVIPVAGEPVEEPIPVETIPAGVVSVVIDPATGLSVPVEMSVAEGSYRIVVLVGKRSGDTASLLAAGTTADSVSVVAGQQSTVEMALQTVSHQIEIPESAVAGDSYHVSLSGDTGASVIGLEPTQGTAAYRGQYKLDEDPSYTVFELETNGSGWSADLDLPAPVAAGDTNWRFSGPYLSYYDTATNAFCSVEDISQVRWRWLSCTVITATSALWEQVCKPVLFESATTGLILQVSWPEE